tara:strand:+ start:91 stop:465 length:375 start_codon:yes stop_codon:yes gene_type:complete
MIQEVNPTRRIMAINLAQPVLGGIYDLYVDALGSTVAWWLGHITIISLVAFTYWVISNWENIAFGLGINRSRIPAWIALILFTIVQYTMYLDYFGFPSSGAFLTAGSTSAYIWWQWYQLEPQKA